MYLRKPNKNKPKTNNMNTTELKALQLKALQNAANDLNLTIREFCQQDKRKTINKFYACSGNTSVSPPLDYDQLNYFLLGYRKAKQTK
jgi:hypothetical protein